MQDRDLEHFEKLLSRLDEAGPRRNEAEIASASGDREALSAMQQLADALAARATADGSHLTFVQVTDLARDRRTQGPDWLMPEHLAGCPLCLEAFEIILAGWAEPEPAALARYRALFHGRVETVAGRIDPITAASFSPERRRRMIATFTKVAAAVAVIAILTVVWKAWIDRPATTTTALLAEGGLVIDDGAISVDQAMAEGLKPTPSIKSVPAGQVVPSGQRTIATKRTKLAFRDGSTLEVESRSRVTIDEPEAGKVTVRLQAGGVTASVTKRQQGQTFDVITPIGEVTVVGTRFKVACDSENVHVFQSIPGEASPQERRDAISAVTVTVFEGVVLVRNKREEVQVREGQYAIIRDNPPMIDVLEGDL